MRKINIWKERHKNRKGKSNIWRKEPDEKREKGEESAENSK